MNLFIDTSAFFALLDQDDDNHRRAAGAWGKILENGLRLITSSYIIVETAALLQSRLGVEAVRLFQTEMVPAIHIEGCARATRRARANARQARLARATSGSAVP